MRPDQAAAADQEPIEVSKDAAGLGQAALEQRSTGTESSYGYEHCASVCT
jgi:hypothetical protein